jgi:CRISPR/Cas system-associated protein Cas10 (large subunit of type III CRISPR-Cas system)
MPSPMTQYCTVCKAFTPHLPGGSKIDKRRTLVMICDCGNEYHYKLTDEQKAEMKTAFDKYILTKPTSSLIIPASLL